MNILFLKYLFWGMIGAVVGIHWPFLWVNYFSISLAFAFPFLGLRRTLLLAAFLSFIYGSYSVASWAAWWFPAALALGGLRFWGGSLSLGVWVQRGLGMVTILALHWFWGMFWTPWNAWTLNGLGEFFLSLFSTLFAGMLLIPILSRALGQFLHKLFRRRPRLRELPLYWSHMEPPGGTLLNRRPFGLEKN